MPNMSNTSRSAQLAPSPDAHQRGGRGAVGDLGLHDDAVVLLERAHHEHQLEARLVGLALGVVHGREVREHVHLQLVVVAQERGHGQPVGRGDVAAVVAAEVAGGEDLVAELSLEASDRRLAHP
jgi:hypothetical protein